MDARRCNNRMSVEVDPTATTLTCALMYDGIHAQILRRASSSGTASIQLVATRPMVISDELVSPILTISSRNTSSLPDEIMRSSRSFTNDAYIQRRKLVPHSHPPLLPSNTASSPSSTKRSRASPPPKPTPKRTSTTPAPSSKATSNPSSPSAGRGGWRSGWRSYWCQDCRAKRPKRPSLALTGPRPFGRSTTSRRDNRLSFSSHLRKVPQADIPCVFERTNPFTA